MIKPLLKRTILALSIFLTIFCFSVLHTDILALAVNNNVTNGEELFSALSSLKNNEIYKNASIVIDSENAIDYGGFSHVPISLSNTYYKDKNISITFNTNVTNVYNKTLKEDNWMQKNEGNMAKIRAQERKLNIKYFLCFFLKTMLQTKDFFSLLSLFLLL